MAENESTCLPGGSVSRNIGTSPENFIFQELFYLKCMASFCVVKAAGLCYFKKNQCVLLEHGYKGIVRDFFSGTSVVYETIIKEEFLGLPFSRSSFVSVQNKLTGCLQVTLCTFLYLQFFKLMSTYGNPVMILQFYTITNLHSKQIPELVLII